MKFLPVMLAAALSVHAASSDPGKAAIDFLEKVRLGEIDLEPGGDTALSEQTAEDKKRQIARRLERMALDLGSDPLEVGSVKLDENFAAVLVRKVGGFDPSRLQVFPVALVKRGAEWMVAPVPASFENAGAGYAIALRRRLDLLENWMLREQVVDLEKLREQSASRMRTRIEASLSAKDLRNFNVREVGERFLAACERRDLPTVLGFLGGLAAPLPDDWGQRLKAADRALGTDSRTTQLWRLLTRPEVVRVVIVHEEKKDRGVVSIACLDPAGNGRESGPPGLKRLQFDLSKGRDGLWQVDPPARLLQEEMEDDLEEEVDLDLFTEFPDQWMKTHPPAPHPTAELARQALVKGLAAEDLQPLLSLAKLDAGSEVAGNACLQAAEVWWAIHNPSAVCQAMPLAFHADESAAVAVFQFFSARSPDRLDAKIFHFEKSPSGWLWVPMASTAAKGKFKEWLDSEAKRWPGQWQQSILADVPVCGKIGVGQAPTNDDAEKLVTAWLDATRRGDFQAAISYVARLDDPRSNSRVLQNVGYEIGRRSAAKPTITRVYTSERWSAVGVRIDQAGVPAFPLFPVVLTPQGPRILIEVDLFAAGNRTREFLNKEVFNRLESLSSVVAAAELRALNSEHQADVRRLEVKTSR